ncbi:MULTISPECIES: hypothetical protein [Terrisporobacter]|uniref:Oxaloacetate decarboxylase, gamma chain n=1 Tax=Terrisporobacter petrolearius TaxID=1460447 RepID=A0ABZ3FBQ8_9FIRM|nr:hypothetical protein [Terrisporobacter hibernicus]
MDIMDKMHPLVGIVLVLLISILALAMIFKSIKDLIVFLNKNKLK